MWPSSWHHHYQQAKMITGAVFFLIADGVYIMEQEQPLFLGISATFFSVKLKARTFKNLKIIINMY